MSEPNSINGRVSNKIAFSYGMGSLGNNIIYAFITTYLLVFYTDYFGLAPAAVATLFLIARIWDGVNDPIMGIIVDNTQTRFGKFRPYLLFTPFIMGAATIACFLSPNFSAVGKLIYAYVTYMIWDLGFTAMDIPYWSMSAAITQDPRERTKVVAVPRTMAMVGFLIVNVLTLPLVNMLGGWQYVAVIYSILAIILTLITFFNVKEKVQVKREKSQTVKDVLHLLKENGPLRLIIISMLFTESINAMRFSLPIFYLKYNLNAEGLIPVFMGVYLIITIAGSALSPLISKRLGKKNAAISGVVISCLASVGMFFTGYGSFLPIILWNSLGAFALGYSNIAETSMLADCVEYGQWKTGNRAEGMVFSTNIFKTKVASAIGGSIAAYALASIGYVPNIVQTKYTLDMMHLVFTLIPGILGLIALIPLKFYDLTEDKYNTILKELSQSK